MALPPDPLSAKYTLQCTWPGCDGVAIVTQNLGVRWKLGQTVPIDRTNLTFAKCHKCQHYDMRIIKAPEPKQPKQPRGFTKVPTE